jgi:hypothetical protein
MPSFSWHVFRVQCYYVEFGLGASWRLYEDTSSMDSADKYLY